VADTNRNENDLSVSPPLSGEALTSFDADGEAFSRCLPEDKTDLTGALRILFHGQDTNAVAHLAVDAVFQEDGMVSGASAAALRRVKR